MKLSSLPRRFAERVARNVIVFRRLPSDLGGRRILVTPDASLGLLKPRLDDSDRGLFRFVREYVRPGDRVWDIGANAGIFSFAAAHRSGPGGSVLAVEPDPKLANLLRYNARRSSAAPVSVLQAAISDRAGITELVIAARGRASNHLDTARGRSQTGGERERIPTATLTLDQLLKHAAAPDVLKIDVEGEELAVLEGGRRALEDCRVCYCEVGDSVRESVTRLLRDANFSLFDLDDGSSTQHAVFNTLAIRA